MPWCLTIKQKLQRQMCAFFVSVLPMAAQAEYQFYGYLSLTSDYLYRGLSLADGKVAPRASFGVNHDSGWFLNTWVGRDDVAGLFGSARALDTELEFHAGYEWALNERWRASTSYAWLEYQTRNQPANHDYQEARAALHYDDRYSFFMAYAESIWSSGLDVFTVSASHRSVIYNNIFFEQEVGALRFTKDDGIIYPYLRLNVGKPLSDRWILGLEYQYSGSRAEKLFDSDRTGSHVAASITYHFHY